MNSSELVEQLVQDSRRHLIERDADPSDPVYAAEQACALFAGDVSSLIEQYLRLVEAYAEAEDYSNAEHIADECLKLGHPLGFAKLAKLLARDGEAEAAREALDQALAKRAMVNGLDSDRLLHEAALTSIFLKDHESRSELVKDLPERWKMSVEAAALEEGLDTPRLPTPTDLKKRFSESTVGAVYAVRLLHGAASGHLNVGGDEHEKIGEELLEMALESCTNSLDVAVHAELLTTVDVANEHGFLDVADRSLAMFLQKVAGYSDKTEWKPGYLVRGARRARALGKAELAERLIEQAGDVVQEVFIGEVSAGLTDLFVILHELGREDEADAYAVSCIRFGQAQSHPRAKGQCAVDVCLGYARLEKRLPILVRDELDILMGHASE